MPRPAKQLPPNGLEIIREAASNGMRETALARALGMSYPTWKRIRDEDPEAREAWEEAKSVEHEKLEGMIFEIACGRPAEFDDKGNQIRAEIPAQVRLRALELLVKCRHNWREQGDTPPPVLAGVQIVLPGQLPIEDLRALGVVPPAPTIDHTPPVTR